MRKPWASHRRLFQLVRSAQSTQQGLRIIIRLRREDAAVVHYRIWRVEEKAQQEGKVDA